MRFLERRHRQPPSIIIVSMIDILVVLLIFLIASTTFKQQPAIKLALPESRQPREGGNEGKIVITVAKSAPYFYLGQTPVTLDQLQSELTARAAKNPDAVVAVRGDADATLARFVDLMDIVKAAGFKKPISIFTKPAAK